MGLFDFIGSQIIPGAIGTGAGIATGNPLVGLGTYALTSNLMSQREQQQYQRGLQKDIFSREDNAVFRRIQDLRNSGLSPTLAAGSAAGAGSAVPSNASQMDMSQVMGALMMDANISQTKAQTELTNLQKAKVAADTANTQVNTQREIYDLNKYRGAGIATNSSGITKTFSSIGDLFTNALSKVGPNQTSVLNNLRQVRGLPILNQNEIDIRRKNGKSLWDK